MGGRNGFRAVFRAFLIVAGILCACGGQTERTGEDAALKNAVGEADGWTVDGEAAGNWLWEDSIQAPADADSRFLLFRPDSLVYLSRETAEYQLHIYDFSSDNPAEHHEEAKPLQYPAEGFDTSYLSGVCFDPSGTDEIWGLWNRNVHPASRENRADAEGEAAVHELVRYDLSGRALEVIPLDGRAEINDSAYCLQVAKTEGFCYLLAAGRLISFTDGGRLTETWEAAPVSGMVFLQDSLYLIEADEQGKQTTLRRLADGALSEVLYEIPLSMNQFATGEDGLLYLSTLESLYRCDLENRTAELVLRWGDADLNYMEIRSLVGVAEDTVSVYAHENGQFVLNRLKPSDLADQRVKLTIAGNRYDQHLAYWIYEFNRSNENYKVVLDDPGFADLPLEEVQMKLQLKLTSSAPPDLVDVGDFADWREMAGNGAFTDLTPFLEAGSPIRESDYLPNIWACGTVGGKQVFIPYSFQFQMLFGQERYVGGDMGWTLEELLAASGRYEEIPVFCYNPDSCLQLLLRSGIEEFVDHSRKTCDFENKLFYDTLECAGRADVGKLDLSDNSEEWTPFDNIKNQRCLLDHIVTIDKIEQYLAYQSAVPVGSAEKVQLAVKGFPSKDGQPRGIGSMMGAERLAICDSSPHKEGAWQFIEYVIEEAWGTDPYSRLVLSAKTDRMRDCFLHEGQHITFSDIERAGVELPEPAEEDVEELMAIVAGLQFESEQDDAILRIIGEEARAYFNGQKSKEETAAVIQSRVGLYLAERR